ncbi:MAG: N-acetylmuramoyl-L-alanine amidase [Clostridia bacterium]|nr:N-acetylmuramoyl-L-alanine amidase [Clostridia bacterium]
MRSALVDMAIVIACAAVAMVTALGVTERRGVLTCVSISPHVLVDAGHGGADGGAEGADGTLEKDINLAIARPLGDLLRVMGYAVSYTRTEDTMVNAAGDTLRERKVSDMKNRLAMIEQADMTISIHQNKFPQTRYNGTQVFYGTGSEDSPVLAAAIRESVIALLQPTNTRELKKGDGSVYLLKHATRPLVLVECGFLSNEPEREKLKTREYQLQMAFAIAAGALGG